MKKQNITIQLDHDFCFLLHRYTMSFASQDVSTLLHIIKSLKYSCFTNDNQSLEKFDFGGNPGVLIKEKAVKYSSHKSMIPIIKTQMQMNFKLQNISVHQITDEFVVYYQCEEFVKTEVCSTCSYISVKQCVLFYGYLLVSVHQSLYTGFVDKPTIECLQFNILSSFSLIKVTDFNC